MPSTQPKRMVYCVEKGCPGKDETDPFAMDPPCDKCGSVMTDVPRAAAVFTRSVAATVAQKARNDPDNPEMSP